MASTSGFNQRPAVFNNEGSRFVNDPTYTPGLGSTTLTPWVPSIPEVSNSSSQYIGTNGQSATYGGRHSSFPMAPRTGAAPGNGLGGTSSVEASTQSSATPNSQGDPPTSDRIVVAVTHDRKSYVEIDITNHVGDAQAIRREIASRLQITDDLHPQFNISRIVSPELTTTVSLGDDELLISCLNFGDDRGTLKFFVEPVSNAVSSGPAVFHAQAPLLPLVLPTAASARFFMPEPSPCVPMPEHTSPTTQPLSEPDVSRYSVPYYEANLVEEASPGSTVSSLPNPSTPPPGRAYIARNTLHSEPPEMSESELSQRHTEHSANGTVKIGDGPRGKISRRMTMDEVLHQLYLHGCRNITPYLNRSMSGDCPVAGGGFGDVYRGALNNGTDVGLKCIRLEADSDDGGRKKVKDAAHELYIWSKCKHPNVLELIGVTRHRNLIAMVSPWMDNGDLTRFLHTHPETDRYNLCVQIADGVAYLHQESVVHGDLKGANILVSKDHTPKITDFGTSSRNECSLQFTETSRSPSMSLRWTAPELISETTDKNTCETDVFSLGMTILEVMTGMVPYAGIHDGAVVLRLVTGVHPARSEAHIPTGNERADLLWTLLVDCWALKPQDRPTAVEVRDRMRSIASM
ncbi:unnamed protein product [Rhizoctonia solani]|uniref:Protein kinase domain-containing protein n=1 Tax=Rhizoctonia solani TaxID=456999 RepID=A0A8H3AVN1_9AGAM|nr:unnamed protein product [Rhizoctonia solani]